MMRKKVLLVTWLGFLILGQLPFASSVSETSWNVELTASIDIYSDVSDYGVRADATSGFDIAYDLLDPILPPIGVTSWFYYPSNPSTPVNLQKLSTSKIPPAEVMTWTYQVMTISLSGDLTLIWDLSEVPSGYNVELLNGETVLANLREVSEYIFTSTAETTYSYTVKVTVPPPTMYDLTISVSGSGSTNPTVGVHPYEEGSEVPVTASPDPGWLFDHWELDGSPVGDTNPYPVTMDDDHALMAVYTVPPPQELHDVEAVSQTSDIDEVLPGTPVNIDVTVRNNGDFRETFDVTCYYDDKVIDTQEVYLSAGATKTMTFTWDTGGVPLNEYIITAWADSGETIAEMDEANNWCDMPLPIFVIPETPFSSITIIIIGLAAALAFFAIVILLRSRARVFRNYMTGV